MRALLARVMMLRRNFMSDAASIHAAKGDQVRAATKPTVQQKIDQKIREQIIHFASQPKEVITRRIFELENEWDIERGLEANAAGVGVGGVGWGFVGSEKSLEVTGAGLGVLVLDWPGGG